MRLADLDGRAVLIGDGGAVDVAGATAAEFGPASQSVLLADGQVPETRIEGIGRLHNPIRKRAS